MYSAAIYNYFNNRQRRKPKCQRKKIPIPKPSKKKHINKCKLCGRKFVRVQNKQETDTEINKQPGNIVFEKVLLIWKYAKNLLSNTVHGNDSQKCSFKIIAHKSYKKRSLHQKIVSSTSILSQICKICEKRRIQMNKCKELKTEEHQDNERVINEHKCNTKKNGKKKKNKQRKPRLVKNKIQRSKRDNKKSLAKKLLISNEPNKNNEQIHRDECVQEKKENVKLCPRNSKSSVKIKKQKCNCNTKTTNKNVAFKKPIVKKKQKPRKTFVPNKKFKTNQKKRMFLKENRKKVNRFASWQYLQHALSSVGEETITNQVNEDSTPVYLTLEEYCLILEAIDTQGSTAEKFGDVTEELGKNIEEISESAETKRLNVSTEDAATNTDQQIDNSEDASTNTEQLSEITEEVATNTESVNETTEESNVITEQTNEYTEELDINTEQLSETTETLAAINDPLSEASEEFDVNIDQPSDIIHFKMNSEKLYQNSSKDLHVIYEEPNESYEEIDDIDEYSLESNNTTEETKEENNIIDNNGIEQSEFAVNNNEENVDIYLVSEEIEQTESPEDTLAEEKQFYKN